MGLAVALLGSCGGDPHTPGTDAGCTPQSCADVGAACGIVSDGCGGMIECGCPSGQVCSGTPRTCRAACAPDTCASLREREDIECGPQGDGCGGVLDCGGCPDGEECGRGGPSRCGPTCTPRTCAELAPPGTTSCDAGSPAASGCFCGTTDDGCGGALDCGACNADLGEGCGAGGRPNLCATPPCVPSTCETLGRSCGEASDGCGGTLTCGRCSDDPTQACTAGSAGACGGAAACVAECPIGEACGAAGACEFVCRTSCLDFSPARSCGAQSDGCGGMIGCGRCPDGAACTVGSGECGAGVACEADCPSGESCGGGGTPHECGAPPCVPRTCADVGADCGALSDGCGVDLDCGACPTGEICGLATPNVCAPDPACTNLCPRIVDCGGAPPTTIAGTVYWPNGVDPLYNALVYVPNAPVDPFPAGPTCDRCGAPPSGEPLAIARTGPDGSFALTNVPAGADVPLVIELGRWRRQITIASVPACATTTLTSSEGRLPRNRTEGDIPRIAVSTGAVDQLECVLRKVGIDASEITNSAGSGRVHLYRSNGVFIESGGSIGDTAEALLDDLSRLRSYDLIMLGCESSDTSRRMTSLRRSNLRSYVDGGGRVFATHSTFPWFRDLAVAPWAAGQCATSAGTLRAGTTCVVDADCTAAATDWCYRQWPTSTTSTSTQRALPATVDTGSPRGLALSQWLASTTVSIAGSRHDVDNVVSAPYADPPEAWPASLHSQRLIYSRATTAMTPYTDKPRGTVQAFSFNTPWGTAPSAQCGRLVFSDFHADGFFALYASSTAGCTSDASCLAGDRCLPAEPGGSTRFCTKSFASSCTSATLSAQERLLGFMIFEASSCVGDESVAPPVCVPMSCVERGWDCGAGIDGCGGRLECGTCTAPDSCGGGGTANVCGSP